MDVDRKGGEELKIKGQANVDKKSARSNTAVDEDSKRDLAQRENELKERALRNKVVRTRKGSAAG